MVSDNSRHGDVELSVPIDAQGLTDGVPVAEIFFRDRCGDDGRIARREGARRISLEHGIGEHRERAGVRERKSLLAEAVLAAGDEGPAPGEETGEILVHSIGQFSGYHEQPDKTAETVVDGWVHTGDVGELDEEGNLRITDRLKDIIITAGGKNITPSVIENELKFSPYISDAVVIGDKRKYLTCLIMIDQENVEHFAQTHSVPFTDYRSLCARREIVELIDSEVSRVNAGFSSVERVKKFRLIDVLLTAEDEELTPTMKLKRSFVSEKYSDLIDSMYAGKA